MEAFLNSLKSLWEPVSYLAESPWIYYLGTFVVLLFILYLSVSYRRSHRPIIPFKSAGGRVEIAPHTLKGVINMAVTSIDGVEKATCQHRAKGHGLSVKVGIHLRSNIPLKKVESKIKARIKKVLFDQFGIEQVDPIHIKVNRIVGETYAGMDDETESDSTISQQADLIEEHDDLSSEDSSSAPKA